MARGYNYGNARLRARKGRLLDRDALLALLQSGDLSGLCRALADTVYREAVESALLQASGLPCLRHALEQHLVARSAEIRSFYRGEPGRLVDLLFTRYDVDNVRAVLRGLAAQRPPAEIRDSTMPIGDLRPSDLQALARLSNPLEAVDLLATWQLPLARPLLAQRAATSSVPALELALERWYVARRREAAPDNRSWQEATSFAVDAANVLTALRLAGRPQALALLREQLAASGEAHEHLFLEGGRLSTSRLLEASGASTVAAAVTSLAVAPYEALLAEGLEVYERSDRISAFERAFRREHLRRASALFMRDPLGIGVVIGYLALKTNEVTNLRTIGHWLYLEERPEEIQKEMVLV